MTEEKNRKHDSMSIKLSNTSVRLVFKPEPNPELAGFVKKTLLEAYLMKASV